MQSSTHSSRVDLLRQWITLIAILGTFGVNVWSNLSPPNGESIGEISNTLFAEVLITPANYAFAIWGLIYLGLIAFSVYQVLPTQRTNPVLRRVDGWLILACVAQIIWVFLFLFRQFGLSLVAMLGILLPLIAIYQHLRRDRRSLSRQERWLVDIPFSVYFGWISVATIVNVAIALYDAGWAGGGISPEVWTVILAIVAAAIAAWLAIQRHDIAYPLVIAWALGAIAVRQADRPPIAFTAGGLALALILLVAIQRLRSPAVANPD